MCYENQICCPNCESSDQLCQTEIIRLDDEKVIIKFLCQMCYSRLELSILFQDDAKTIIHWSDITEYQG